MKRISDTERLIDFAMSATEDALNGAIQSLTAIRNNRFPVVKQSRKPKKAKIVAVRSPKSDKNEDEPAPIARKCVNCDWKGKSAFPEPCPECGEKTEAA